MTWEDKVFVADVVVTDLLWEMMTSSVIIQLAGVIAKHITIVKIHKYKRLHEGHYFILMAMKVHGAPGCDMDCAFFSMIND